MLLLLLLLVYPPVRAVFLNHEVAVLQPQTGNALDLGPIAIIKTFILVFPCPTHFNRFKDLSFFTSTIIPPPHQSPFIVVAYLYVAPASPTLLSLSKVAIHLDDTHTRHPPASANSLCDSIP